MGNLLFSMDGRINAAEFSKGALVLLAINFFLWPSWFLHTGLGFLGLIGALVTIYCWACLFIKRLRDAGQPGGWFALLFILFVFLAGLISFFTMSMRLGQRMQSDPDLISKLEDMQTMDRANPSPDELAQVLEFYALMGEVGIIPAAITFLLVGGGIAFVTNSILKSKP